MIYYVICYSNECTCYGMPIHGTTEYLAFKSWKDVNKYLDYIEDNYRYHYYNCIDPKLVDSTYPKFKEV